MSQFFAFLGKKPLSVEPDLEKVLIRIEEKGDQLAFLNDSKVLRRYAEKILMTDEENISQLITGLLYRSEMLKPLAFELSEFAYLKNLALEWKKNHPLVAQQLLTAFEIEQLKISTKYPAFLNLVLEKFNIREKFFRWILQDENETVPFIEFPATVEKITQAHLNGRISRFGHSLLKLCRISGKKGISKILTLPFEGHKQSILDPDSIVNFKGSYRLKMKEIFSIFSRKEYAVGNLEMMQEGIVNWNIHHLGIWNQASNQYEKIKSENKKWWETLPVFRILKKRQMLKRLKIPHLLPHQWIVAAVATREKPNLDFEDTHAFLEVVIPLSKGQFAIYDFGKLAFEYPQSLIEKLLMITKTVTATVAYPDENVFYTHRQQGVIPFAISPKQGLSLMQLIANDITTSRSGNFIYQIESENCAKWVHLLLENILGKKNIPDIFRMQLLDTEPKGAIKGIFNLIKKVPKKWQVPLLTFLHLPIGAARKIWIEEEGVIVSKSLSQNHFFETGQIFLPALLIEKLSKINHFIFKNQTIKKIHSILMRKALKKINSILPCYPYDTWNIPSPIYKSM